jgi:hypothetical protein
MTVWPVLSGVDLMAVAKARENPGKVLKNSNGAEWAPIAVEQEASNVWSRAGPIPGT